MSYLESLFGLGGSTAVVTGATSGLDQQEYRDWIMDAIPAGRVGEPDEIVGAVLFLASRASDMVVGHNLLVDGGRTVI